MTEWDDVDTDDAEDDVNEEVEEGEGVELADVPDEDL